MKKILASVLALMLALSLTACNSGDVPSGTQPVQGAEQTMEPAAPTEKPTETPAPPAEMTADELEAALLEQPMYVESTSYLVQSEEYKTLYPDLLQATIKNNSGTDIKNAVLSYAAWDANGFPIKIIPQFSFDGGSYVVSCNLEDVNMVDGATYGQDKGMTLSDDMDNIETFKVIVKSYEDFDGNTWENPCYNDWVNMYSNKKLVE